MSTSILIQSSGIAFVPGNDFACILLISLGLPLKGDRAQTSILHDERIFGYVRDSFEAKPAVAGEEDFSCRAAVDMSEGLLLSERDIGACAASRTELGRAEILQEAVDAGVAAR